MNIKKTVLFADHLAKAVEKGAGVEPLTVLDPNITIEEAYHVQLKTIEREVETGAKIVGKKIGLTSLAMQKLLGVDQPDYGHLLDRMAIENHGKIPFNRVLQPRVEAEIAFMLNRDLVGPRVTTTDVLLATEYVMPALEIVDSRIANWKIKLADTVADNASSGLYVLGDKPTALSVVHLPDIQMQLFKNGEMMNTGKGSAVLGNPVACVAWLANKLSEFGISLKSGEVILSGALSAAIEGKPGDMFTAKFSHLGEVSVTFTE